MRSDALGEAVAVPCGLLSPQRAAPALQGPRGQLSVSTAVRNPPNCFSHTWEAVVLTRSFPPALLPALEAREGVECGRQEHGALPRPAPWGHRSALQGPPAGPTAATAAPGILGAPRALSPAFCLRAPIGVDARGAGCTVTSAGGGRAGPRAPAPRPLCSSRNSVQPQSQSGDHRPGWDGGGRGGDLARMPPALPPVTPTVPNLLGGAGPPLSPSSQSGCWDGCL